MTEAEMEAVQVVLEVRFPVFKKISVILHQKRRFRKKSVRYLVFESLSFIYLKLQAIAAALAGSNAPNPAYFVPKKVGATKKIVKIIPTHLMTT